MDDFCQKLVMIGDTQKFTKNVRRIFWKIRENNFGYFWWKSQFPKGISNNFKLCDITFLDKFCPKIFKFVKNCPKSEKFAGNFRRIFQNDKNFRKFSRKIRRKKSRQKVGQNLNIRSERALFSENLGNSKKRRKKSSNRPHIEKNGHFCQGRQFWRNPGQISPEISPGIFPEISPEISPEIFRPKKCAKSKDPVDLRGCTRVFFDDFAKSGNFRKKKLKWFPPS